MKSSMIKLSIAIAVVATCFASFSTAGDEVIKDQAGSQMKGKEAAMMKKAPMSRAYLHGYNLPSSGVALEGYCPVCYISANKAVRGTKEFAADHNGVTCYFVHAGAMKTFQENPEKFLPDYGGWCATGMAMKDKFPIDPTNFKVVVGRLLFFLTIKNVDAQKLWNNGNQREPLAKPDAHWKTINK